VSSPLGVRDTWRSTAELTAQFTAKTATGKGATEKKRQRKKRQRENWAIGKIGNENERVGKQGNTKLMREITATEKNGNGQQKIGQREHLANFPVAVFSVAPLSVAVFTFY